MRFKIPVNARFIGAGAVAAIGVTLAVRAILGPAEPPTRTTPPPEHETLVHKMKLKTQAPAESELASLLSSAEFVKPKASTVKSIAAQIRDKAAQSIERNQAITLDDARKQDFLNLIEERVNLLLEPDFERYEAMIVSRGGHTQASDPKHAKTYRRAVVSRAAHFRYTRIAPEEASVHLLFKAGEPQETDLLPPNVMSNPEVFKDVPDDPFEGKLDVVELRVPVYTPTFRFDPETRTPLGFGESAPTLVGFAMAWDRRNSQWTPWRTNLYYSKEGTYIPPSCP